MAELLSQQHVRALRTEAQGLNAPDAGLGSDVSAVAARMLAVQGQDWHASRWALGRRVAGASQQSVIDALNAGKLVRSWPMRGTIHLVAATDIGWLQSLTNKRALASAPQRRKILGMSDEILDQLVGVSLDALRIAAAGGLDRNELSDAWTAAGIVWQSNWRYHLIWWLCQNGLATLGPVRDLAEPRLVLAAGWLPTARALDEDEALLELAARYPVARGPIRAKDIAWWSGLGMREVKRGLTAAVESGRLATARFADEHGEAIPGAAGEAWLAPSLLDAEITPPSEALLLAPFDEHLLGYSIREPQLIPGGIDYVVPGKNGVFAGTVIRDGQTIATWKRDPKQRERVYLFPFPGNEVSARELERDVARWSVFHDQEAREITVGAVSA
ncbi:AlkZ family DNA glycosylase [Leucobacter sp. cx-328]|uniref:winged helix DNA-binding domain-containing protein n=1 Tax=unclassified Leucobacter TaxID=2621730 RepID=UPI00165E61E2|nr:MULTISPECIES: winged helix DNA-binding domain-containing protein [unclassified Leucobacter]MBC9943387.1 AlkZ family DNA glycosylase [Leucobacter sp. cx-328]